MADVRHRNITEGEKHEPKNFSTAPVYAQLIKDENSTSRYLKIQLLEPALNFVDGFVAPPVSPIIGDTYLVLDEGNGVIDAGWDSCIYNDLARFNGVEWIGITPTNGNIIYNLTSKVYHEFKDGVWSVFIPEVPTLYSADGTILTGREATITDTLTFLGGRVGIGQTPDASAILDLSVNNKGIKFPEVDNAEMIAIGSPADHLLTFNTEEKSLYFYNPLLTAWDKLTKNLENSNLTLPVNREVDLSDKTLTFSTAKGNTIFGSISSGTAPNNFLSVKTDSNNDSALILAKCGTYNDVTFGYYGDTARADLRNKSALRGAYNGGPLLIANTGPSDVAEIWFNISNGSSLDGLTSKRRMKITNTDVKIHNVNNFIYHPTSDEPLPYDDENITIYGSTYISGYLKLKNDLKHLGYTSSASAPTVTELPTNKDYSIHKDTAAGTVYLAYNDGGTIKTTTLT